MRQNRQHIKWWMSSMMMLLLMLCACGGGDDATETPTQPVTPTTPTGKDIQLAIGVTSPALSAMTRAGNIAASETENKVNSLQIWVFEHGSGALVSYLNPTDYPTATDGSKVYQMNVSESFANSPVKPAIDIYVLANMATTGLSLGSNSNQQQLNEAVIASTGFAPATSVPANGLPMSGVLYNKAVVGDGIKPVLHVTNYNNMEMVPLTRAVSKMRFVFTKSAPDKALTINSITIDENVIPQAEHVFLANDSKPYHVGNSYIATATPLITSDLAVSTTCSDPTKYVYQSQDAQDYEELIDKGVDGEGEPLVKELTQSGPYYFLETDKKVSGKITYQIEGDSEPKETHFAMQTSGDFSRNHSWIVYAYYEGLSGMQVISVYVTPWTTTTAIHETYNW